MSLSISTLKKVFQEKTYLNSIKNILGQSYSPKYNLKLKWTTIAESNILTLKLTPPSGKFEEFKEIISPYLNSNNETDFKIHENEKRREFHIVQNQNQNKNTEVKLLNELFGSLLNLVSNYPNQINFDRNSSSDLFKKENVIVEYGSPNIAKPLHMGHMRSSVVGNFVYKVNKAAGHNTHSLCYLGDWGTQFGILQAGLSKWLQEENCTEIIKSLEISQLLNYYIKAVKEKDSNPEFSKLAKSFSTNLENLEPSSLELWKEIRKKSLTHLTDVWAQLGIHFDLIQGESEFTINSQETKEVLRILEEKDLLKREADGCFYVLLPPIGKDIFAEKTVKIALVKNDGSSLYLLRDLAAIFARKEKFKFDRLLYVVDKSQANHFSGVFTTIKMMDIMKEELSHVQFGKVEGMSTRSGNFVLLSDTINYGRELMEEERKNSPNTRLLENSQISQDLAISSLITHMLHIRRIKDMKFDWNIALRPNGETGVFLQYNHARLKSLEEKQLNSPEAFQDLLIDTEYILNDPVALDLFLFLKNFEDIFWYSYNELEPNILLTYLFRLCNKSSKALLKLRVQSEENQKVGNTRLFLFCLTRKILSIGLNIIGIKPLDQI